MRDVTSEVLLVAVGAGTWITIFVLVALYVFLVAPILVACFLVMSPRKAGGPDGAVADVERFVELRERARAELAASGSLDKFMELKSEARKQLWQPSASATRPNQPTEA